MKRKDESKEKTRRRVVALVPDGDFGNLWKHVDSARVLASFEGGKKKKIKLKKDPSNTTIEPLWLASKDERSSSRGKPLCIRGCKTYEDSEIVQAFQLVKHFGTQNTLDSPSSGRDPFVTNSKNSIPSDEDLNSSFFSFPSSFSKSSSPSPFPSSSSDSQSSGVPRISSLSVSSGSDSSTQESVKNGNDWSTHSDFFSSPLFESPSLSFTSSLPPPPSSEPVPIPMTYYSVERVWACSACVTLRRGYWFLDDVASLRYLDEWIDGWKTIQSLDSHCDWCMASTRDQDVIPIRALFSPPRCNPPLFDIKTKTPRYQLDNESESPLYRWCLSCYRGLLCREPFCTNLISLQNKEQKCEKCRHPTTSLLTPLSLKKVQCSCIGTCRTCQLCPESRCVEPKTRAFFDKKNISSSSSSSSSSVAAHTSSTLLSSSSSNHDPMGNIPLPSSSSSASRKSKTSPRGSAAVKKPGSSGKNKKQGKGKTNKMEQLDLEVCARRSLAQDCLFFKAPTLPKTWPLLPDNAVQSALWDSWHDYQKDPIRMRVLVKTRLQEEHPHRTISNQDVDEWIRQNRIRWEKATHGQTFYTNELDTFGLPCHRRDFVEGLSEEFPIEKTKQCITSTWVKVSQIVDHHPHLLTQVGLWPRIQHLSLAEQAERITQSVLVMDSKSVCFHCAEFCFHCRGLIVDYTTAFHCPSCYTAFCYTCGPIFISLSSDNTVSCCCISCTPNAPKRFGAAALLAHFHEYPLPGLETLPSSLVLDMVRQAVDTTPVPKLTSW